MEYLFNHWEKFSSKIQNSPYLFLFFDYDGTLTPIVSRPEEAKIPHPIKELLKILQRKPKWTVAIISGRSLKDIKKMVGLKGIVYAGNHGMEIEGQGFNFSKKVSPGTILPIIKEIAIKLQREFRDIKDVEVENKGMTLSVHYRLVKTVGESVLKKRFDRVLMPYVKSRSIILTSGKKVFEARPNISWDKGMAVEWLLKRKRNTLPVYLGDDRTDIDGFRAIKGRGISIFIGHPDRTIRADYFLNSPGDVEKFIKMLVSNVKNLMKKGP